METKRYHIFTCPICEQEHVGKVDDQVDERLSEMFPNTYGNGRLLICDACLPLRLQQIAEEEDDDAATPDQPQT